MKLLPFLLLTTTAATTAIAEDSRHADAHEHGVGVLNIAFDGLLIAMEFEAPGADIVGFEYAAESAEDRAAIETAIAQLAKPLELFMLPDGAGCTVSEASAALEGSEDHEKHDEDGHDDHASKDGDDHKDDEDHGHSEDEDHDHKEGEDHGDHDDHAEDAGHTEFHAAYLLDCTDTKAVDAITFAYFEVFQNALEVEVQVITDTGATAFEVARDAPTLDLSGLF